MNEYYSCGVFRVHMPKHALQRETPERQAMREAKIDAITKEIEKIAQKKDANGKYLAMDYAIEIKPGVQLVAITGEGDYDIFLLDKEYGKRIDVLPSELDAIAANCFKILVGCEYSASFAEKGRGAQYLPPGRKAGIL